MSKSVWIALSTLFVATIAAAHPGHGEPAQGATLAHHLTEPVHVLGALGFVLLGLLVARSLVRRKRSASRIAP